MESTSCDSDALGQYYYDYKVAVYFNLFTGIVYGAYILLYATSVYVLLKPGFTSSPPRIFMFGITTFMFILGIIALVLVTIIVFEQMRSMVEPTSDGGPSMAATNMVWAIISHLMYILCDSVCAWRTVVLWRRDKRIIAILLFFILGTTVAAGFALSLGMSNDLMESGKLDLLMVGPTLGTNLLSTGLIAWKAWQRRISVRKHLREGSVFFRVDRVFALLIESGLVYCCVWGLYLILAFRALPYPDFTIMVFISGLYPTVIIILVGMQMSPVEHYSSNSSGVRLSGGTALRSVGDDTMIQHGVSIHREYTNDFHAQIPFPVQVMEASKDEKSFLP